VQEKIMATKEPVLTKYQAAQAKLLVGRTIKDVQFVGGFPVLVLDNNNCVVIQQDDEGNGPGSMMFQHIDGTPINVWTSG
jgi:hypothetical protein